MTAGCGGGAPPEPPLAATAMPSPSTASNAPAASTSRRRRPGGARIGIGYGATRRPRAGSCARIARSQVAQRRAGLDPELAHEVVAGLGVDAQRVGLAARCGRAQASAGRAGARATDGRRPGASSSATRSASRPSSRSSSMRSSRTVRRRSSRRRGLGAQGALTGQLAERSVRARARAPRAAGPRRRAARSGRRRVRHRPPATDTRGPRSPATPSPSALRNPDTRLCRLRTADGGGSPSHSASTSSSVETASPRPG